MKVSDLIAFARKYAISLGCAVFSLVLGVFIYLGTVTVGEKMEALKQKTAESEKILATIKNGVSLPDQMTVMAGATRELDQRLLRAGELAKNLQYFYRLESETGIKLADVHQGGTSRSGKSLYVGVPYTLSLQGSYRQILDFIGRLETGTYFFRLNSMMCSRNGQGETDQTSANLNIELLGLP